MQVPNISLSSLLQELSPGLEGGYLKKIQALSKNGFRFRIHGKDGTKDLVVLSNALFFSSYKIPAIDEHKGFVEFLRSRIEGKKISSVSQHGHDRIVKIEFNEYTLVFELFATGNVVLVDPLGVTAGCLHREEWKDRKTWPKHPYHYPQSKPLPTDHDEETFFETLKKSDKTIVLALLSNYNLFPLVAEEIALSCELEKISGSALTNPDARRLFAACQKILGSAPSPVLVTWKNEPLLLPFPLERVFAKEKMTPQIQPNLNDGLDHFFAPQLGETSKSQEATTNQSKQLIGLEKSLADLDTAQQNLEKSVLENQQKAELLYGYYNELTELFAALSTAMEKKLEEKTVKTKIGSSTHTLSKKVLEVNLRTKKVVLDL